MRIRTKVADEPVTLRVLPDMEHRNAARLWAEFGTSDDIFGLDVETTATDEDGPGAFDSSQRLRLVQFGSRTEAWVLDPANPRHRAMIVGLLSEPDVRFVSHTNYDPLWVRREFGIDLDDRSIDTKPMADLVHPGIRVDKDLKSLSTRYIDDALEAADAALLKRFAELAPRIPTPDKNGKVINRKPQGKKLKAWGFTNIALDDEVFGRYAGLDAVYVRRLLDILAARLKRDHMGSLSKREQRIARLATDMQWRGYRVDVDWTNTLLDEIGAKYRESEERLYDVFGYTPRSPRVPGWLEAHGVRFTEFTRSGAPELSKDTLPDLVERYADDDVVGPVLRDKWELSQNQNLLNNLRKLLTSMDDEGFVHPRINTNQGVTGRMSIVRPAMQTFKKSDKRLRGCFISRDGKVFVGADYDSQEIRIAAALSRDATLLEIIATGKNQHVVTYEKMFGEFDGNKDTETYKGVKILDFAQQYGAGPAKIGDQLGLPRAPDGKANPKAVEMWNSWRAVYAGLVIWTDKMQEFAVVVNPWGRRIPRDPWRAYANGNYMIQSSGRDMLGGALLELEDRGWDDTLWLPIHDEIVLEVDEDRAEEAKTVLAESMFTEFGDIPVPASPEIVGTRWGGAKSLT